ncbi:Serpin peptidase inhibitor, clade B (Ovalbumin), member [Chamberlinius hualienensis]
MGNSQRSRIAQWDKESATKLAKGHLAFSLNTYKAMSSEDNLVYSPFSLGIALVMTAAGAGGNTLKQMKDILHLNELGDETKINQAFLSVLDSICSNPNYSLSTANRMYLQNHLQILQDYKNILKNYYKASAENVDFKKNSDGVAQTINQWVENKTNRTIKNLFSPGSIAPETSMILVNAIYFKGTWKKKFKSVKTMEKKFILANEQTVPVPMMNMESRFKYDRSEELKSKILKMDYAGDRLAMYIILPDDVKGLSTLQQQLTPELLTNLRQQMTETDVIVVIPKLKLKSNNNMVGVLKHLGMTDLFDLEMADLSKIYLNRSTKLIVSDVVHEAYVEVDEKGTTAAAVTGIHMTVVRKSAPPDPVTFIADHPFMFIIHDALNDLILFMGHVTNPKS